MLAFIWNLSPLEVLLIVVLAIFAFGRGHLAEVARALLRALRSRR